MTFLLNVLKNSLMFAVYIAFLALVVIGIGVAFLWHLWAGVSCLVLLIGTFITVAED